MPELTCEPRSNRLAHAQNGVAGGANESVYALAREHAPACKLPRLWRSMTNAKQASPSANASASDVDAELRAYYEDLRKMQVATLQDTFFNLYGRATRTHNHAWLVKRVFYRVQEIQRASELSAKARERMSTLSDGESVNVRPVCEAELPVDDKPKARRDPRLPPVGTCIEREHEGVKHRILVLDQGFEFQGRFYVSLSTIAREITGTSWNGFLWAGLTKRKARSAAGAR
jgi:hypothetical protein